MTGNSSGGGGITGHDEFDRWKTKFSNAIGDVAFKLRGLDAQHSNNNDDASASSSSSSKQSVRVTGSIRKASTCLNKLALIAGEEDHEDPALEQNLLDVYEACKMQLKTYQLLHKQLRSKNGFPPPSFLEPNEKSSSSSSSIEGDRKALFGAFHRVRDKAPAWTTAGSQQESIAARTQGKAIRQTSKLQDALKSLRESEAVAQSISGALNDQRATLTSAGSRLGTYRGQMEHSSKLLDSMNKPWWRKW